MRTIDGKAVAAEIRATVAAAVTDLRTAGTIPTLAVVLPTADESARWYASSLARSAERASVACVVHDLPTAGPAELARVLDELSADPAVHGIICQTPLPAGADLDLVSRHLAAAKDVDGIGVVAAGRLALGLPTAYPATAAAVLEILRHEQVPLAGVRGAVVGRSSVVGKPAALLLLAEHATVTVCHSRTVDLPSVTRTADILVVAVGRPAMIRAEHVRAGAVVIDVGTNPSPSGGLVGDVDAESVTGVAGALTPVPGGVGPVTTAILLRQTVAAAAAAGPVRSTECA